MQGSRSWLTRAVFLRALALIYLVAFSVAFNQGVPLLGRRGLLPISSYLDTLGQALGGRGTGFWANPTLFWLDDSDSAIRLLSGLGIGLTLLVLAGATNALVMATLWLLQLSLVNAGQLFYGYGWETLLCEAGFLAIFLCPVRSIGPLPEQFPTPAPLPWLLRWLLFRLMFGAGLIKLRGDVCWRDLTCLAFHYETQPNPNPIAFWLHHRPLWVHQTGVLWNHFIELVVPFFLFGPRRVRNAAALLQALFQVGIIVSGNLSFLNWLTLALCLGCLDDGVLERLAPARLRERVRALPEGPASGWRAWPARGLAGLVVLLSIQPTLNLLSSQQLMNYSFNRLHLVNTYGAFGTVGRERDELSVEGTLDDPASPEARWREYVFKCKPGPLDRRPCLISPYHLRLDWQMWFAAMSELEEEPWLVHLVYRLLQADPGALSLLAGDPFAGERPRAIRIQRYVYRFAPEGHPGGAWWVREPRGPYMRAVTLDDPALREALADEGWPPPGAE